MKKIKVVYIHPSQLSERWLQYYKLDELQNIFDIEYWDCSAFANPSFKAQEMLIRPYLYVLRNENELRENLTRIPKDSLIVCDLHKNAENYGIYKIIAKLFRQIIYINFFSNTQGAYKSKILSKLANSSIKDIVCYFLIKRELKIINISSRNSAKSQYRINHPDYEQFQKTINQGNTIINKDFIVYIDNYFPFHPEISKRNSSINPNTPGIPEDIRRQVLFLTAGIVTLTLSINATTMRWLLRRLGLIQVSNARVLIDSKIQGYLHDSAEKYMEKLSAKPTLHDANWNKVKKYLPPSLPLPSSGTLPTMEFLSEIRLRILDREKAVCHQLYDEGVVSKTTFLHLMNSLDEMYDHDGQYTLDFRPSIFDYCDRTSILTHIQKKLHLGDSVSFYFRERIVNVYDMARGFIILQNEDLNLLNELNASELLTPEQKKRLDILRTEINHNIDRMNHVTLQLEQNYPKAYRHALTVKSIRMMLTYERRTIRKLQDDGVISEKDAERFIEKVDERTDQGNSFRYSVPGTLLRGILHAIGPKKR